MTEVRELVTIIVPVKNEEKNLPGCLENIGGFPHVVMVDSGSTDSTRSLFDAYREAHRMETREWTVLDFVWNGYFPKKRNWTLRNFTFRTPWAMFLDADERLTPAFLAELGEFLSSPASEACDVVRCFYDNWFMDRMLRHGDTMQKTALLRVGAAEYEKIDEDGWSALDMEIHEHIVPRRADAEHVISARLEHHDRRSLESYYAKHEEYAKWEANRARTLVAKYGSIDNAPGLTDRQRLKYRNLSRRWFAPAYFFASYVLNRGFLDGRAGFIFARAKMRYFANIREKLREAERMEL